MLKIQMVQSPFDVPTIVLTLKGHARSEAAITALRKIASDAKSTSLALEVFEDEAAIRDYFAEGHARTSAVVLYDGVGGKGSFKMQTSARAADRHLIPAWAQGTQWAVSVRAPCNTDPRAQSCARQVWNDFHVAFEDRLGQRCYPWGRPKKGEPEPVAVVLPNHVRERVTALNAGPDLAHAIAHTDHALELPTGSRISWVRVPADPVLVDERSLAAVTNALRAFERACGQLVGNAHVQEQILAGVTLDADSRARDYYVDPGVPQCTIQRADLHFTGDGVFASEIDEMPGGMPELVHIDAAYGNNVDRWASCFSWLAERGLIVFLVSHEWSRVYVEETRWLVNHLNTLGHAATIATTNEPERFTIGKTGVQCDGTDVGTIWRLFPIFETKGFLLDLIECSRRGGVRIVPEFGHFGNKAWFSVYAWLRAEFTKMLDPATVAILDGVLPASHIIRSVADFPVRLDDTHVASLAALRGLPETERNGLVLKICGANTLSARSYGVLMGHGLNTTTWQGWIDDRLAHGQPFIVQKRKGTTVARMPVFNTKHKGPELFRCRLLMRPWVMDGTLVSVHGCAVPEDTTRVHGRVDMAVFPVRFTTLDAVTSGSTTRAAALATA